MIVGIDIGTTSIKVALVSKQKNSTRLVSMGAARSPIKGMQSESEPDLVAISQVIKKLLSDARINTREVAVALPESEVITKVVAMPNLSDQELSSAIEWEAEQYIPIPIADANISYEVVERPKTESGQMKVLLVASSKKLVEKYLLVLGMAGLKVIAVETELLAAARALTFGNDSMLIVDAGARSTDMAVVVGGRVVFTRSIATAGEALTRAVALGLSMELAQAEEYKKAYGLSASSLEGKIRAVIMPVFEVIAGEVRKAIEFYRGQNASGSIKTVILTGGTAGLPGFVPELASRVGLEVVIGDPFLNLAKEEKMTAAIAGYSPLYAVAVGLSLKEV